MYTQPKVVVFLGPPGAGKGTQAARLAAVLGCPAISTGEILRRECQSGSELGKWLERVLQSGQLVSDELINDLVACRLSQEDCRRGCILDGFPRTVEQARALDGVLAQLGMPEPVVFDFTVPVEQLIHRLQRRRQCPSCGRISSAEGESARMLCENDGSPLMSRADDRPAVIRERLRNYRRNARDLVRYYRARDYHSVSARRNPEAVGDELLGILGLKWTAPTLTHLSAQTA